MKFVFKLIDPVENPLDGNVDVEILLDDGRRFVPTFFTLNNIQSLMSRYEKTGECAHGLYFWASDMIIVRDLSSESIQKAIQSMIEQGDLESACTEWPAVLD